MFKLIQTSLFCLILFYSCSHKPSNRLPASTVKKKLSCAQLLKNSLTLKAYTKKYRSFDKLESKSIYRIVVNQKHFFEEAYFLGSKKIDGINQYTFVLLKDPKTGRQIPDSEIEDFITVIPENNFTAFEKISIKSFTEKELLQQKLILELNQKKALKQNIKIITDLIVATYSRVLKKKNIQVVTNDKRYSKKLLQNIAKTADDHFNYYEKLGFKRPKNLKMILQDNKDGPVSYFISINNIHNEKEFFSPVILSPLVEQIDRVADDTVVSHEITHTLLQNFYHKNSFVHYSDSFQEALADFFTANRLDQPKMLDNYPLDGQALRNIQERLSVGPKKMNSFMAYLSEDPHDISVHFSHVLWNLREIMGEELLNIDFKNIIDDLNSYYASYIKYLYTHYKINIKKITKKQQFYYDIQFFLSVLQNRKYDEKVSKDVRKFLDNFIVRNQLSLKHMTNIFKELEKKPVKNGIAFSMLEKRARDFNQEIIELEKKSH